MGECDLAHVRCADCKNYMPQPLSSHRCPGRRELLAEWWEVHREPSGDRVRFDDRPGAVELMRIRRSWGRRDRLVRVRRYRVVR